MGAFWFPYACVYIRKKKKSLRYFGDMESDLLLWPVHGNRLFSFKAKTFMVRTQKEVNGQFLQYYTYSLTYFSGTNLFFFICIFSDELH